MVYTRPNSERKVASAMAEMGFEPYLPLYKAIRQWSDRKKKIFLPLFPNYVFIKASPIVRHSVYTIRDVVRFVSVDKSPAVINESQILAIKRVLNDVTDVLPEEYFSLGSIVRISSGPFAGLEGTVVKRNGNTRLIIRIEGMMKAFSFSVSGRLAQLVSNNAAPAIVESHLV